MFLLFVLLFGLSAQAQESGSVHREALYRAYYNDFFNLPGFLSPPRTVEERKISLDAVEDALTKGAPSLKLLHWYSPEEISALSPADQLRLFRLKASRQFSNRTEELLAVARAAQAPLTLELRYEILRNTFATEEGRRLGNLPSAKAAYVPPSAEEVRALFSQPADLAGFQQGRFVGAPRLFLFCRHRREYACLLVFKDKTDQPYRVNGKLWTQPALAMSVGNIPYDQRNGNTPTGVQIVNGVMPAADWPQYYGKFRRLVLEFVPSSSNEQEMKKALPEAARVSSWWREAVVARDIGRDLLRMHGTGEINPEPYSTYYPFIPTIGCVAQREGKYGKVDYTDQRSLLDAWMLAAGQSPAYGNETGIRGLIYVIDINNSAKAVSLADLKPYGIE